MSNLPEGINEKTSTKWWEEDEFIPTDYQDLWDCPKCELALEALLLVTGVNRYEGLIRNPAKETILWSNKLPRNREKALEVLKTNFSQKVENHRKVH